MDLALLVAVVAIALCFAYTNGFHDAANAVATSVATRALTPRTALLLAAVMNLVGALLGTGVAETVSTAIVDVPRGTDGLTTVLAALLAAIVWNLLTWWRGLPSSSSHALVGGLAGAGVASVSTVHGTAVLEQVALPLIVSPLVGLVLAYLAMVAVAWAFRHAAPRPAYSRFRLAQTVSAAAVALGHGLQDAQKTMGVIVVALVAGGVHTGSGVPLWVVLASAGAISLGTWAGGWRIMRTLGRRVVELDPARGVVAETVTAAVLYVSAFVLHAPVSTTHTLTASVVGVGATGRVSAVRWRVVRTIAVGWLLTIPATAALAALAFALLAPLR